MKPRLGIYEKALPAALDWPQRFEMAAGLAFDFIEISVDESPERQARLRWNRGRGWRSWPTKLTAALMCRACASPRTAAIPLVASIAIPGSGAGTDA